MNLIFFIHFFYTNCLNFFWLTFTYFLIKIKKNKFKFIFFNLLINNLNFLFYVLFLYTFSKFKFRKKIFFLNLNLDYIKFKIVDIYNFKLNLALNFLSEEKINKEFFYISNYANVSSIQYDFWPVPFIYFNHFILDLKNTMISFFLSYLDFFLNKNLFNFSFQLIKNCNLSDVEFFIIWIFLFNFFFKKNYIIFFKKSLLLLYNIKFLNKFYIVIHYYILFIYKIYNSMTSPTYYFTIFFNNILDFFVLFYSILLAFLVVFLKILLKYLKILLKYLKILLKYILLAFLKILLKIYCYFNIFFKYFFILQLKILIFLIVKFFILRLKWSEFLSRFYLYIKYTLYFWGLFV